MMSAWLAAAATPVPVVVKIACKDIFSDGNCTTKTKTISDGLANIISTLTVLVGMLALIFVIISGLQMVLSAGDAKRYQQGREGLKFSVIGVVLALMAYALVTFISSGF